MSSASDFLVSVLHEIIQTALGWTVAVLAVMAFAAGVGLWVGGGAFPGFVAPLGAIVLAMSIGLFHPLLLLADGTTAIIWCVPIIMENDSLASRVLALVVVFAIWLAVGLWMGLYFIPALLSA